MSLRVFFLLQTNLRLAARNVRASSKPSSSPLLPLNCAKRGKTFIASYRMWLPAAGKTLHCGSLMPSLELALSSAAMSRLYVYVVGIYDMQNRVCQQPADRPTRSERSLGRSSRHSRASTCCVRWMIGMTSHQRRASPYTH